jgi:FKBP-type peptidyl-prolyl cis-trans isomerase
MNLKYIGIGAGWLVVIVGLFFFMTKHDTTSVAANTTSTTNNTANTNTTMDTSKLVIQDEVVGTGDEAKAGNMVTVHYVGSLTNGTMFDASRNHGNDGFEFALGAGQA